MITMILNYGEFGRVAPGVTPSTKRRANGAALRFANAEYEQGFPVTEKMLLWEQSKKDATAENVEGGGPPDRLRDRTFIGTVRGELSTELETTKDKRREGV